MASDSLVDSKTKVDSHAGIGINLKLTETMAASVPKEPIMSFAISRPATFFTTMPPDFTSLPSTVAKGHADDEVARRPVQALARAGGVRGDHAADRGAIGKRRVERNHLAMFGEERGEVAPRRGRLRRRW